MSTRSTGALALMSQQHEVVHVILNKLLSMNAQEISFKGSSRSSLTIRLKYPSIPNACVPSSLLRNETTILLRQLVAMVLGYSLRRIFDALTQLIRSGRKACIQDIVCRCLKIFSPLTKYFSWSIPPLPDCSKGLPLI